MPRTRRSSNVIAKAIVRSNNLKAISPPLDLGGGLTVEAFDQLIARTETAQDDYNQTIALLDEKGNLLDTLLKQVNELSARMLAGVGAKHGKNSNEYEVAGGTRPVEIKRNKGGNKGGKSGGNP